MEMRHSEVKLTTLGEKPTNVKNAYLYLFYSNGEFYEKALDDTFIIGSATNGSVDINISSDVADKEHGEFLLAPQGYIYRDLSSSNGTYINGIKYGTGCEKQGKRLEHGDVIHIKSDTQAVTMIYTASDDELVWYEQPLDNTIGEIEIGRDNSTGISFNDSSISRKHATFRQGVYGWCIIDHNSRNGVFVNGQINKEFATVKLDQCDVVRISNTLFVYMGNKLIYCLNREEKPAKVNIQYEKNEKVDFQERSVSNSEKHNNVEKQVGTKSHDQLVISIRKRSVKKLFREKTLLEDINLTIEAGSLVLILGGSGAGKSTFIKAVLGYEKAEGEIIYNDTNIYKNYNKVRNMLGYATQENLLRESNTVWNTLYQAAEMRMPDNTDDSEREKRVNEVLELLGLQREVETQVKNLSGGQQKRLGIAVEYISDPKMFFLDEPDSGLDGMMAIDIMKSLRIMADDNKIVMVISHAPDRVADLFDKVIVLAKSIEGNSGQLAFYGGVDEAKQFFEVDSLEHIVKRINRPDENGEGLSDFYINKYKEYRGAGA